MRHPHKGLTLVEMMVTVAIAALLAMVTGPSLIDLLAKRRLDGFANELSTDIQFARSEAVSRNVNVAVAATANTSYTITAATATPTALKTVSVPSTVTLTEGTVTFNALRSGTTGNAGSAFTVGSTKISNQLQVSVNAMGRPQICAVSASWGGYSACP